jgi:hypothetical protein
MVYDHRDLTIYDHRDPYLRTPTRDHAGARVTMWVYHVVTMSENNTQALRPAPIMDVGGSPTPYGHASAASDE